MASRRSSTEGSNADAGWTACSQAADVAELDAPADEEDEGADDDGDADSGCNGAGARR
jgi:hypothetical protein